MQQKTVDMMEKMKGLLVDHEYTTAGELAESCGLSKGSIYRMIRKMRESGVGVIPAKKGYILAEYAQRTDDVHFLRKLNGRRTSDYIAVRAAEHALKRRWRSISDRETLKMLVSPLRANLKMLQRSEAILRKKSNSMNGKAKKETPASSS